MNQKNVRCFRPGYSLFPVGSSKLLALFLMVLLGGGIVNTYGNRSQRRPREENRIRTLPVNELIALAEAGNTKAQIKLGKMYFSGDGQLKPDPIKAAHWFRRAADQGDPVGQFNYAVCLDTGRGVPRDQSAALEWYQKAAASGLIEAKVNAALTAEQLGNYVLALQYYEILAQKGMTDSMMKAAEYYREGRVGEINPVKTFLYTQEAARRGNVSAQVKVAEYYQRGFGVAVDLNQAVSWLWIAANNGDLEAKNKLAACYMQGLGVSRNPALAIVWLERAAEAGFAPAKNALGDAYLDGHGVEQSNEKSAEWFARSARLDNPAGLFRLGVSYALGRGVERNAETAITLFRQAAEKGHADAQYNLGFFLEQGMGVEKPDYPQAVYWYRKGAAQNNPSAMHALALCLLDGIGVAADEEKGRELLLQAARKGSAGAIKDLRERFSVRF